MTDFLVGPGGNCPICYRHPCTCRETKAQQKARLKQEKATCQRCGVAKPEHIRVRGAYDKWELICPTAAFQEGLSDD